MRSYSTQTLDEYYVDFDTPNISFLKMAALLDAKGIKNNLFFLKLYNKKLRGVNPYDKNLSDEQKFMIFKECSENRWYFYREVFRVGETGATTDVGGGIEFILNRGNLALLWAEELNISSYLIMPRQKGKTWAVVADSTWTHQFVRNSTILHFNKNQSDANGNLRRISQAISMLPLYLQHSNIDNLEASDKRKVKNNEKTIRNILDSTIEAMASAGNEAKADAIARGKTASKIWYDEMAFIFFNEAIYGAATPAYEKAREVAERNEIPYSITITTTPGDLATPHGAFAYKMMDTAIKFDENMYDMKLKKLMDIIHNTPDKTDFLFIQFSYLQLGETDEWYISRAKKMNNPIKARREYLLEWINSNGNSPFDPDDIELIGDLAKERKEQVETLRINKYFNLNVYSHYTGKKPVLIGVDVSGGLGRDCSTAVAVNPESLMPMAVFRSNMISSDKFKKLLVTIVMKIYPNCIISIENNSVGKPLIDELKDTPIANRLYKEKKKRKIDQGINSFTKTRVREVMEYGHNTNPTTRAQMMEMLESIVHSSPAHVAIPELYEEIRFLELKNGRIDHGSATHDDVTMAFLGILWVVRYGKGLKNKHIYYTIRDDDDDVEEYNYDYTEMYRAANKALQRRVSDDDDDDLVTYMSSAQPVETSGTLLEKEQREYYKALDQIDGVDEDYDGSDYANMHIPEETEKLLLRNLNSMYNNGGNGLFGEMNDNGHDSLTSFYGYD